MVYYNLLAVAMDAVENGDLPPWPGVLLVPLAAGGVLALLMWMPRWRRRRT